jgi:hypothetical protein
MFPDAILYILIYFERTVCFMTSEELGACPAFDNGVSGLLL